MFTNPNLSVTLPITITTFTATKLSEQSVKLAWETSQEINSDKFYIRRSTDRSNWDYIGSVKAAGNSNTPQQYSFVDNHIPRNLRSQTDRYFYQLVAVDFDEKYDFSEIRTVTFDGQGVDITVYPNPTVQELVVDLGANIINANIDILDIQGKLVYSQKVDETYNSVPVIDLREQGLATGTYIIRIQDLDTKDLHTKKVLLID